MGSALLGKFITKIWAATNLTQDHKWSIYCRKLWHQHIKISARLHIIEAQERHEKSPKKITSTHARCGYSGGLLICIEELSPRRWGWDQPASLISFPVIATDELGLGNTFSVTIRVGVRVFLAVFHFCSESNNSASLRTFAVTPGSHIDDFTWRERLYLIVSRLKLAS